MTPENRLEHQPCLNPLESDQLHLSYTIWFEQMAEQMQNYYQQLFQGRRTTKEIEKSVWRRAAAMALSMERLLFEKQELAKVTHGYEGGFDYEQAQQDLIQFENQMLQHGIRPQYNYWTNQLSTAGENLFAILLRKEREREKFFEYNETHGFDFDLTAAITELHQWGILDERKPGQIKLIKMHLYKI